MRAKICRFVEFLHTETVSLCKWTKNILEVNCLDWFTAMYCPLGEWYPLDIYCNENDCWTHSLCQVRLCPWPGSCTESWRPSVSWWMPSPCRSCRPWAVPESCSSTGTSGRLEQLCVQQGAACRCPSTLENKAGGALKSLKLLTEGRDKVPQTAASVSGPCVLPGGSATVPQSVWGGAWHQVLLEKQVMWCDVTYQVSSSVLVPQAFSWYCLPSRWLQGWWFLLISLNLSSSHVIIATTTCCFVSCVIWWHNTWT